MESLTNYFSDQTIRQIGWVLVHFLWQGCTVGAVMWAALKILGGASSNVRYLAGCAGMVLMMTAPVATFTVLNEPEQTSPPPQVLISESLPTGEAPQEMTFISVEGDRPLTVKQPLVTVFVEKLEAALPWCVIGWAAGVAALSLWYLGGWRQLQKLRLIGTRPASEQIAAQTTELAQRLGITRAVRITESVLVQVPTMIGWLRPVILLPATALTGLDEVQLRAMVAHELAHIRRHDYLVNIFQTAFEILGFYHPAVWWMSKQIRVERENCCDDMAAELVQDRAAYAKALFSMEEIRIQQLALALRANGGSLVDRIGRLIGKRENTGSRSGWIASATALLILSGLVVSAAMAMSDKTVGANAEKDHELVTYRVDRKITDYPETEDFLTPEKAYAAINRVMASGSREGWIRVSTKANAERIAQSMRQDQPVPAEWAKVVLNARILKVLVRDDRAMVIAEFPQDLSSQKIVNPIDARSLKLEDGKWLNAGEDRFDSIEEAEKKFGALVERESETERAYKNALDESAKFEKMTEEFFSKLRNADYENILSDYDEQTGKWEQDGWKRLDLSYTVCTDWPSFAVWVCRTFKDNPIVSVDLGDAILSKKEFDGHRAPAVPYKLTLQNGGVLQGELYFAYRASSGTWQPAEGIDWHLQEAPFGSDRSGRLSVVNLELEPAAQGKNVLYATVQNDTDQEQVFAIHIYTRSPDYGPEGVGWGRPFFETLKPNETRRLRFVYHIQGPVTDKTYVHVKYYNPASQAEYDYEKPFAERRFQSDSLQRRTSEKQNAVTEQIAKAVTETFTEFRQSIREKNYDKAWAMLTKDHQEVQYHSKGFERFEKQMEPVHPLDSGFVWEKADLLTLKPTQVYQSDGSVQLEATTEDQTWTIHFVQEDNRWKIDWIGGYTPAVVEPLASEVESSADKLQAEPDERQVSIEARFILADDSFEESMGLEEDAEGNGQVTEGFANSDEIKAAKQTKPLTERDLPAVRSKPSAESGFYSLDSKAERILIRAVQSFKNSKVLTAPKAVVLNTESASMRVVKTHSYVDAADETKEVDAGVVLDVLPFVQDDGKTILLQTHIQMTDILEQRTQIIDGKEYTIPWVQVTIIPFQARVESGGTILISGPEVSVKNEQTGELEKQRLYVLLKPTVLAASKSHL